MHPRIEVDVITQVTTLAFYIVHYVVHDALCIRYYLVWNNHIVDNKWSLVRRSR